MNSQSFFRKKARLSVFALRRLRHIGLANTFRMLRDREVGYAALELAPHLPARAKIIIDAGAHRGVVSEALQLLYSPSCLIAVEPSPQHHAALMARLGRHEGFHLVTQALAAEEGHMDFYSHTFDAASSLYTCKPGHLEQFGFSGESRRTKVGTTTLATLMSEKKLPRVDLLKLDCQGAELAILKGAGNRISDITAVLIEVSFEPIYDGAPLFSEVHGWLNDHGFTLVRMDNFAGAKPRIQWADALYLRLSA